MTAALEILAAMAHEAGPWGATAAPWQWHAARGLLVPTTDTPRLAWLGRVRGASKSTDAACFSLAWILHVAAPLAVGYFAAADEDQADRLIARCRVVVSRTPALRGRLRIDAHRVTNLDSGAQLVALSADAPSAEGLLTDWLVLDEFGAWPNTDSARSLWAALVSATAKTPRCRLTIITHAGRPASWQHRIYLQALRSEHWWVQDVSETPPWVDAALLEAQREVLPDSEWRRRHRNEWVADEDVLATREDVEACLAHVGALPYDPARRYIATLDVGVVHDRTALVVAHVEPSDTGPPTVVVDSLRTWQGSRRDPVPLTEVEAAVVETCKSYSAYLHYDPSQAKLLGERVRAAGVWASEYLFTGPSTGRLGVALHLALRNRRLRLPSDRPDLVDELCAVKLRPTTVPGQLRLDTARASEHDDMAVAVGMAVVLLTERSTEAHVASARDLVNSRWTGHPSPEQLARLDKRPAWLDRRIDGENPEEVASLIAGGLL